MNKRMLWGGGVLLLVFGGLGAAWQGGHFNSSAKADDKKPEVPLEFAAREVVQPQRMRLPQTLTIAGPLVAPRSAVVRARATGTLTTLTVAEGDRVRAGQVLGRLELADVNMRVVERQAQLASARVALAQAERLHTSNKQLAAQQFISEMALENSNSALEAARASMQAVQATLDTTRVALRDASLVAPIAGIVAKRMVLPGEKISTEQQMFSIVDLAVLEVAGIVGTHEVSRLSPGMPVQVQVEGVPQAIPGRVARIAPAAEPGTRSIGVTISLANPQEKLRAGQYAVARATLQDDTERLTLPLDAVGNTAGQDHVWMIENGVLARRAVTLGMRDATRGRVEVLQGVAEQSQVLAARFENLREGAKALMPAASAAQAAPAPNAEAARVSPQARRQNTDGAGAKLTTVSSDS